jgi:hypothetical protein
MTAFFDPFIYYPSGISLFGNSQAALVKILNDIFNDLNYELVFQFAAVCPGLFNDVLSFVHGVVICREGRGISQDLQRQSQLREAQLVLAQALTFQGFNQLFHPLITLFVGLKIFFKNLLILVFEK